VYLEFIATIINLSEDPRAFILNPDVGLIVGDGGMEFHPKSGRDPKSSLRRSEMFIDYASILLSQLL
jgi:hypothetical protein